MLSDTVYFTDAKRSFGLDLARALAIVFVMMDHSKFFVSPFITHSKYISGFSFYGVELFFVLSGYLIGKILLKQLFFEQSFNINHLVNFWQRRWLRTIPNYLLILLVVSVVQWDSIREFPIWKYLFFIQNFDSRIPSYFMVSWSLSVEEWFYLIFPITLLIIARLSKTIVSRRNLFLLGGTLLVVVAVVIRQYSLPNPTNLNWNLDLRQVVIFRIDAIGYGVFMAYLQLFYSKKLVKNKNALFIVGLLILAITTCIFIMMVRGSQMNSMETQVLFMLTGVGFALVFPFLQHLRPTKITLFNVLIYQLSIISYALYLINYDLVLWPLAHIFEGCSVQTALIFLLLFWSISISLAGLVYYTFELPILKLRDKIAPKLYDANEN